MARLPLTVYTVTRAGVDIGAGQAVLAADGAEVVNDGNTMFRLENTSAGAKTATFITPITILSGPALPVDDQGYEVAAGPDVFRFIGKFPPDIFNTSGKLQIDVSVDGLKITAIRMAP